MGFRVRQTWISMMVLLQSEKWVQLHFSCRINMRIELMHVRTRHGRDSWFLAITNNLFCTEELYKKDLHDPDSHSGVITDLEPDILECEVKWALESITMNKASGGDGIPVELFQSWKMMLHSICQQIWKTQQWPQDCKKVSFHSNPKERQCQRMLKLLHNCTLLTC